MNAIKNAGQVLARTSEYLESGVVTEQPAWYKVLAYHPPIKTQKKEVRADVLQNVKKDEVEYIKNIRNYEKGDKFFKTRLKPHHIASELLKPQKLHFIEDDLRSLFYRQHPWELADAKSLIENERTMDIGKLDWSHLRQFSKPLDGESVVQRSLYLHEHNTGLSLLDAYEQAKYEYYRLKIEDEAEENITWEESEMFGAVYRSNFVEQGFAKEMGTLKRWATKSVEQTRMLEAKRANNASAGSLAEEDESQLDYDSELYGEDDVAMTEEEAFDEISGKRDGQDE